MADADALLLPPPEVWRAPASWRCIDLISDLHLSEATPRTFAAWSAYLQATPADAVLILGDLFEAWVGDDARESGFEAQCAEVLSQAARHRTIGHMVGNRDFLVGSALLEACGIVAIADPTVLDAFGRRVLLTHGDALCVDDVEYQRFRAQVRSPQWRHDFLARPLGERRAIARQMRTASEGRHTEHALWIDVDGEAARAVLDAAGVDTLIHGHTHRPADEDLGPGAHRIVLSDWDVDHAGPARAEVLRWQRSGFARMTPAAAVAAAP